MIKNKKELQI